MHPLAVTQEGDVIPARVVDGPHPEPLFEEHPLAGPGQLHDRDRGVAALDRDTSRVHIHGGQRLDHHAALVVVADRPQVGRLTDAQCQADGDVQRIAADHVRPHRRHVAVDAVVPHAGDAHGQVAPPSASTLRPMNARSSRSWMPRSSVE